MLSIIVPTLNEEKHIPNLLNCLKNQTYKNFEIIVVDAHSNDKTKEVVKKFGIDLYLTNKFFLIQPKLIFILKLV